MIKIYLSDKKCPPDFSSSLVCQAWNQKEKNKQKKKAAKQSSNRKQECEAMFPARNLAGWNNLLSSTPF